MSDPFSELELEPTLDRALIKRAYFGLLRRHPPHSDPEGFRRIRDAYERLSGDLLMREWSSAALDITRELAALDNQLAPRIEAATRAARELAAEHEAVAAFAAVLTLGLDDAIARFE